jgi:HemK-like putative methylase
LFRINSNKRNRKLKPGTNSNQLNQTLTNDPVTKNFHNVGIHKVEGSSSDSNTELICKVKWPNAIDAAQPIREPKSPNAVENTKFIRKVRGVSSNGTAKLIRKVNHSAQQALTQLYNGEPEKEEQEIAWINDYLSLNRLPRKKFEFATDNRIRQLRRAYQIDPLLPKLIGPCLTNEAAQLELKWLREHVEKEFQLKADGIREQKRQTRLEELCDQRHAGVPLQYILGTAYFGDLELQCRPGVLIPRSDTADQVLKLIEKVREGKDKLPSKLKVLDLCSGSGCISLLMAHSFPYQEVSARGNKGLEIVGVDSSDEAIELAEVNRQAVLQQASNTSGISPRVLESLQSIRFLKADILENHATIPSLKDIIRSEQFDIVISNPPYISKHQYLQQTSFSVREYEPRSALVPPDNSADLFYPRILEIAESVGAKAVLVEVGSFSQARRVKAHFSDRRLESQIWTDGATSTFELSQVEEMSILQKHQSKSDDSPGLSAATITTGDWHKKSRAVFGYKAEATGWIRHIFDAPNNPSRRGTDTM